MKLSIITINYNNKAGLEKTIESVMLQTWRDFEWIIIDGGSTDGSKDVIENLASKSQSNISYWCSEPDRGIYNALNKGTNQAKGEYLNFMNSGDSFSSCQVLEKIFVQEQNEDILYGDAYYLNEDGSKSFKEFPDNVGLIYFLNLGWINHQASFTKRTLFSQEGYDEGYKIVADTDFFFRQAIKGCSFKKIDLVIADFDYGGASYSKEKVVRETCLMYAKNLAMYINDVKLLSFHRDDLIPIDPKFISYVLKQNDAIVEESLKNVLIYIYSGFLCNISSENRLRKFDKELKYEHVQIYKFLDNVNIYSDIYKDSISIKRWRRFPHRILSLLVLIHKTANYLCKGIKL